MNSPKNTIGSLQVFSNRSQIDRLNNDAKYFGIVFPTGTHNMVKLTMLLFYTTLIILSYMGESKIEDVILNESKQVKALQFITYFLPLTVSFIGRVMSVPEVAAIIAGATPYVGRRVKKLGGQMLKGNYAGVRNTITRGLVPNMGNLIPAVTAASMGYSASQMMSNVSSMNPILKSVGTNTYEKFTRDAKSIVNNPDLALKTMKTLNKLVRLPGQKLNTRAFSGTLIRIMESVLVHMLTIIRVFLGKKATVDTAIMMRSNSRKLQQINKN